MQRFWLHGSNKEVSLVLNYPRPETNRNELRLYFRDSEFKPKKGDMWFTYIKDERLFIGFMGLSEWLQIDPLKDPDEELLQLAVEDAFQDKKGITPIGRRPVPEDQFNRNAKVALEGIENADFKCEMNCNHEYFISRITNKPYCEAHHFIPIWARINWGEIDVVENIFCLCPFCHRAIHHGDQMTSGQIVETLFNSRKEILKSNFDIELDDLKYLYKIS